MSPPFFRNRTNCLGNGMLSQFTRYFFPVRDCTRSKMPYFLKFLTLTLTVAFFISLCSFSDGLLHAFMMLFFPFLFKGREYVMIGRWSFCFDSPIGKEIRRASITCNGINFTFFLFALVAAFMLITFFLYILRIFAVELDFNVRRMRLRFSLELFINFFCRQGLRYRLRCQVIRNIDVNVLVWVQHPIRLLL